jgi:glycosyltransferase involved in cell wall biosynthesis
MPQPLVSIIIDNYNYASFLGAAIRSALDQSYDRIEVIVVDDGSTDDSRAVIAGFGDRIRAIFQPNQGQSGAFNSGFAACRGDIVLFLDSDDALRADAVAEIVAAWREGVAKAQFCLATVDAEGGFLGNVFPNFPPGLTSEAIRAETIRSGLYPCPPTSGNAYARSFLLEMMPLRKVIAGADGPLNTVAPLYGDVVTIDKPLGYYRVHGRNDGAHKTLAVEKFARFVRHDADRIAHLREHARRLGIPLDGDPLDRAVLHLQYRAASLKLLREQHPVAGETLPSIVRRAVRAAWRNHDRVTAKLFLSLWFLAVASLPRPLAKRVIAYRFAPESRPRALMRLLQRLRVLRPPARGAAAPELSLPRHLAPGKLSA